MSDVITVLSDTIFVSLVNTAWQMTLLIPLVALLIWMFRIKSAATRYSIWLFVLFAIIALPLITPFIPQIDVAQFRSQRAAGDRPDDLVRSGMGGGEAGELPEDSDPMPSVVTAKVHANSGSDVSLINPVSIAYFIWCAGALLTFCITLGAHINLRRLRVNSPDVKDPAAMDMLSRLKQRVKVRRPVALKVTSKIYTPMSLGIFSPTIILPDGGFGGISDLEMILTHELAHIRRCDYLVNILQNILKAIFFFHPLYHLMNRNLAKEREHICDDWVIHVTEQRSGYAECIIGLLEKALHKPINVPVTLAMAERKRDIPGRIDMIVDRKRKTATKISRKALIAVSLIGFLTLLAMGGARLVRFAEAAGDEGKIVFTSVRDGKSDLYVMDADGSNVRRLTHGAKAESPARSPDGKKIAFISSLHGTPVEIYVIDADGSNMERLTDTPGGRFGSSSPSWSPDGKKIGFCSYRDGWPGGIYVMDADGGNCKALVGHNDLAGWNWFRPSWSLDGKRIAFCNHPPDIDDYAIWVMNADGSDKQKILDLSGWDMNPVWSPDGKRIVFWNSSAKAAKAYTEGRIYIMDADGENLRELTDGRCPSWSPDGKRIVFCSNGKGAGILDTNDDIYVIDADGRNLKQLTDNPKYDASPDWWSGSVAVEPAGKLRSTWGKVKALIRPH